MTLKTNYCKSCSNAWRLRDILGFGRKEDAIQWDQVPLYSRVISIRRPRQRAEARTIEEVRCSADRLAAQDYKKYGCELRGYVKQLPAMRAGEVTVGYPTTLTVAGDPKRQSMKSSADFMY